MFTIVHLDVTGTDVTPDAKKSRRHPMASRRQKKREALNETAVSNATVTQR